MGSVSSGDWPYVAMAYMEWGKLPLALYRVLSSHTMSPVSKFMSL